MTGEYIMIKNLVEQIIRAKYSVHFSESAENDILQTNKFLTKQGFAEIPEDYREFLLQTNGIIFNGTELMGTAPQQRMEKQYIFPDLTQINKLYAKYDYFRGKLIIGRLPESLLIYDGQSRVFAVLDRVNLRSRLEVPSFRDLLSCLIKISLK